MNCPLYGEDDNPRTLATIEFKDFDQLEGIEEGYAVEYKSEFNNSVGNKIQKIIASFANSGGGWLFIGIGDKGKYVGIEKQRSDFSQTIAQYVRQHITPIPRYETRFVSDGDSNKGILVVEVYEGAQPPYVVDGTVYIRIGSSSEKMKWADSSTLIDLYRKARSNLDEAECFCHRTVYYPTLLKIENGFEHRVPILDVYLKHLYAPKQPYPMFDEIDQAEKTMMGSINEVGLQDYVCHHAHHSLIFRDASHSHVDSARPAIELFYDGSIKISIPLRIYQTPHDSLAINRLRKIKRIDNTGLVRIINGDDSMQHILPICFVAEKYIQEMGRKLSDYFLAFEFENMEGIIVEFKTDEYKVYVKERGFPFFATLDERTKPVVWSDNRFESDRQLSLAVWMRFAEGFGFHFGTTNMESFERVQKVMGVEFPGKPANKTSKE